MSTEESLEPGGGAARAARGARGELDRSRRTRGSPERALEILGELSELAKAIEEELERAKRAAEADAQKPDELRALVEDYLEGLELWPHLHGQAESVRYSITVGGKRVRPVICLATAEAAGAEPEEALQAGCALELVHTFSLVHDDLPSLDNDEERRGQPSTWKHYGEAVGILAGDALLAEAFRLATSYDTPLVARELANATLGMIGGQYLDITGTAPDEATLHRLKTGCLFEAAVALGLWVARVPESRAAVMAGIRSRARPALPDRRRHPRRRRLRRHARRRRRPPARRRVRRPRARALDAIDADTSVLRDIVDSLAVRTA